MKFSTPPSLSLLKKHFQPKHFLCLLWQKGNVLGSYVHMNYTSQKKKYVPVFSHLRWECGQALAKPPLRWWKSLSLNMLSLKKASSRKNTWDTWANDEAPSVLEGGSSCSRVRVRPPRVSRNNASGLSCSAWPLCERPAKIKMRGVASKTHFFVIHIA